jgi:hypothetical protein
MLAQSMSGGEGAPNGCQTALDATKEAIRKTWVYLRDTNLNETDLSLIQLYAADLSGALIYHADIRDANFRCANLADTKFDRAKNPETAHFEYANVHALSPIDLKQFALAKGAMDINDRDWQMWRDHGFRITRQFGKVEPVFVNSGGQRAPCFP